MLKIELGSFTGKRSSAKSDSKTIEEEDVYNQTGPGKGFLHFTVVVITQ